MLQPEDNTHIDPSNTLATMCFSCIDDMIFTFTFFISKVIVGGQRQPNQGSINHQVICIRTPSLAILLLHSTLATISSGNQILSFVEPKTNCHGFKTNFQSSGIYNSSNFNFFLLSSSNGSRGIKVFSGKTF